jgi:hypothetical protein
LRGNIDRAAKSNKASNERKIEQIKSDRKFQKRNHFSASDIDFLSSLAFFYFLIFPLIFIPFRKFVRSCHLPLHMLIIHQFKITILCCTEAIKSEERKQKQVD